MLKVNSCRKHLIKTTSHNPIYYPNHTLKISAKNFKYNIFNKYNIYNNQTISKYFTTYISPKLYADANLNQKVEYYDFESMKLKYGYYK